MTKKTVNNIEDIAKLAGVSKSTVSRALNDSPLIKPETKERIQAIALEHNFRINAPAAQSQYAAEPHNRFCDTCLPYRKASRLRTSFHWRSWAGSPREPILWDMISWLYMLTPRDTKWAHNYLDSGRVDGFVLMTSNLKQTHIKTLVEMDAPFIVWG